MSPTPILPATGRLDVQPFSAVLDSSPIVDGHDRSRACDALGLAAATRCAEVETDPAEETLSGNTVNIEQQMINLGDVNRDFSMTTNIRRAFHQLILSALK